MQDSEERARLRAQSHAGRSKKAAAGGCWGGRDPREDRSNGISSTTIESGGRREMERPKVGPKGTQAARVAARESAEGNPLRGEMSGSERVNIDERDRASQTERIFTNGERQRHRIPW